MKSINSIKTNIIWNFLGILVFSIITTIFSLKFIDDVQANRTSAYSFNLFVVGLATMVVTVRCYLHQQLSKELKEIESIDSESNQK